MDHKTVNMMLDAWADHRENKPPEPNPDLGDTTYQIQCEEMLEWGHSDRAWKLLVGIHMAENALEARISDRKVSHDTST